MARTEQGGFGSKLGVMPTLILVTAALYVARDILIPLALAILLAFLLTPAVKWLERRRLPHVLAVVLVVSGALGAVVMVSWVVGQQFVEVASELPKYSDNIQDKWRRLRSASQGEISRAAEGVEKTLTKVASTGPATRAAASVHAAGGPGESATEDAIPPVQNQVIVRQDNDPWSMSRMIGQYSGLVLSPLATMGLILVFAIFILVNRRDLGDRILWLAGDARLHLTTQALDDAATRITHYLLMQLAINLIYGVCVGIGLWTIGACSSEGRFPNVMVWALLAMLLRFLPYLGPWLAAALPLVLSVVLFSNVGVFLATAGLYVGLEIFTSNVVEPWLYGSSTGMSAVAVLGSAVFWTWLWGPVGLLLATPLTVCLVVLGKYVPQLRFLAVMLGDEAALEPSVRVYQRLLSLDQEEAGELLHEYHKAHGLEKVYEEVMIPALVMAERDGRSGTLDSEREVFVCQAMRDLVEQMGEAQKKRHGAVALAEDSPVTVLCLPAHNEADEIAGMMLAQLLELKGQRATAVSQVSLAGEILELIEAQTASVVCISALPPAALAHSRYLCKRLRARFANLPTLVALWTSKAEPVTSQERLSVDGDVYVASNVTEAMAKILEMVQPLMLKRARDGADAEAKA